MRRNIFQLYLTRGKSPFLGLPAEVRMMIIRYVLLRGRRGIEAHNVTESMDKRFIDSCFYYDESQCDTLAILRVNKKIKVEAMSVLYNLPFIFESYDLHCLFFVERKLRPSLLTNRKLVTRMDLTIKGADWPGWPSDFLYVIENLKRFKRLKFLAIKIDPEDLFIDELEDPEAVGYEFHECLSELIRYVRVKTVRVYGSYGSDGTDVLNAIEQMMMGKTCALLNPMCEIDKSHFRGLFSGKAVTRTLRG